MYAHIEAAAQYNLGKQHAAILHSPARRLSTSTTLSVACGIHRSRIQQIIV